MSRVARLEVRSAPLPLDASSRERELHALYVCTHPNAMAFGWRTYRNGQRKIYAFCAMCPAIDGPLSTTVYGHLATVDVPDQRLLAREISVASRRWFELRSMQRSAEWWARYSTYLRSPEWLALRRRILDRDPTCRLGRPGCQTLSTQAHHLTYERVFNEDPLDLIGVCFACHEVVTAESRGGR